MGDYLGLKLKREKKNGSEIESDRGWGKERR